MSIFGAAGGLGEKVVDSLNFIANDEFGDAFVTVCLALQPVCIVVPR